MPVFHKLESFFEKTIHYSFYLLFFLVPLILTPWNYELFEFNKMLLTYGLTSIILSAWIGKMILLREIKIQKTPLDIPILLYLISAVLSTIYSIEPHTSLWGYYSRSNGGLLSIISYIVLYYAFVSNFANFQKIIKSIYILLFSAFLVSLYGILEHFGIDSSFWIQDVKNRVFSTMGQPNWLGAFIDSLIFIPIALLLIKSWGQHKLSYILCLISYIFLFFCLLFTNSKSSILAFFIGLIIFSTLILIFYLNKWKQLLGVWIFTLVFYLLLGSNTYSYLKKTSSWFNTFSQKQTLPSVSNNQNAKKPIYTDVLFSESSEIRKVVWTGAIKVWQNYPLLGSGLETFAYSYYNFRPKEHNLLSEWDFLYNKAHNEFLNILACQGLLGLASYLLIVVWFLGWFISKLKVQSSKLKVEVNNFTFYTLNFALISGYITILITNFFGFSVVVISLLFFLIPAFCFMLSNNNICQGRAFTSKIPSVKNYVKAGPLHVWQYLSLGITFLALGSWFFTLINIWRADFYFSRGEKYYEANYLVESFFDLQKATQLNLKEPIFHSYLAQNSAKLALVYQASQATDSAKMIKDLTDLAVFEAQTSVTLNPVHLNFWRSNATTFIYLAQVDKQYRLYAQKSLEQAIKISPTDPKNYYNLGVIYNQWEDLSQAENSLKKAIELKPNYRLAYIELASLYEKQKQYNKVNEQIDFILNFIDPHDKFSLDTKEKSASWRNKL